MAPTPTRIDKHSLTEMLIHWNNGEEYALSYVELRFACPCASCVDEHTGRRTLLRSSVNPEVHPLSVSVVGRYAVQVSWSDRHDTGIHHYDRLYELCVKQGRRLNA